MEEEIKTTEATETVATEAAEETKSAPAKPAAKYRRTARGKKRLVQRISTGRAYIKSTYNNTIVTLTDQNGNVLAWSSAGGCGFRGPKKSTPYAASIIVKNVAEKAAEYGLKDLHVYVKGVGSGRDSAIRSLNANGFNILGIKDVTPLPHNGCRLAGRRRI